MRWLKTGNASRVLGMHPHTLRKYADKGIIESIKNEAGQRLFNIESYVRKETKSRIVSYCRVSSSKQKDDLARQVIFMRERFPSAEVVTDIGSGLNFKRKGLLSLLDSAMCGNKLTLIVAHRDRLARFGYELIEHIIKQNGGEILVLDQDVHSPSAELTKDLLSILTVFSRRMHGLRSYRDKIKKDKALPNERAEVHD